MTPSIFNKRILITGCCGTVGKELLTQICANNSYSEIFGIDNNESSLFFVEQEFSTYKNCKFSLGDVRNVTRLKELFSEIDIIFHTAAYKHVGLCERSPMEAVENNINGVQNVIDAASSTGVKKVIFTSSDKAVNPTNVMGTSKLMGERLMTAANSNLRREGVVFASTRFGNVLGSRGSVIPIFREQIRRGGPITLTDPEMTRFIMSIKQAARLVLDSAAIAKGGEVFITKMPVIRIQDLAAVMIHELAPRYGHNPDAIKIQIIGTKPGEKMYEELMSAEETRRALELKHFFAVLPAFKSLYNNINYSFEDVVTYEVTNPYNSCNEPAMSQDELASFLSDNNLFDEPSDPGHPTERHWP